MLRRFTLPALVLLAAGLAVAACGGSSTNTTGDGPAPGEADDGGDPGTGPDGAAGSPDGGPVVVGPDTVTVIVEPTDKAQALLTAIQSAKTSIHMTMYLLDDKRFISALIAQKAAGRDVKVLLNKTFSAGAGTNQSVFDQLQAGGVAVAWAPAGFTLTHEKCVIVDAAQAWIMTMNLEATSPTNREYLAVDSQAADVQEAEAIFAADFAGTAITPQGNLVVAPVNARDKLVALIAGAKTSVDLEGEELSDTKVVGALVAAQKRGVPVRVVLADNTPTSSQTTAVAQLKAANVKVVSLGNPYIHAKAIAVDSASAYVGSENFTTGSLVYNRELGVITTNAASASVVATTIAKDFAAGSPL